MAALPCVLVTDRLARNAGILGAPAAWDVVPAAELLAAAAREGAHIVSE
jgi:hypothetical protein